MAEEADVTIGMVTYNRLDFTKKTFVGSLIETGKKFNLVVCDNNSSDDTKNWILNNYKSLPNLVGFKYKFLSKNYGIAYGRNVCLNLTKEYFPETKFISTLDNDIEIPNKNWLMECCDVIESSEKIGCCAVNFEKKKFPPTIVKNKAGQQIRVKITMNSPGTAATVFRKNIHDKIGYFRVYGSYAHEDANFFYRVKMLNLLIFYLDQDGIHLGDNEVGEYREMKTKQFKDNYPLFLKDVRAYSSGMKSLYEGFKEEE